MELIVPPIGQKSMQNSMFLAGFRLIWALKMKIGPPETKIAPPKIARRWWFWREKRSDFRLSPPFFLFGDHLISERKTLWISVKTFFFGDHLNLERKTLWISVKTFFFGDHLNLERKTLWISVKTFFFGDHLILERKRSEFRWRSFFSGDHLILERKTLWISEKTYFFLEITWFWREKRSEVSSIQSKTNENLGQVRLRLIQISKKPPPPLCEILATRL